ncbi:MAG: ribosome small subunit-dependent GTPase A [Clostridia bacterium]|nr:ribosome small subunit-dependent GTPase A [Clostridia bacterium]
MKSGKIIKGVGGFYTVLCADGSSHVCKARGLFRKKGETPIPGDNVEIAVDKKGEGYLLKILPRVNELLRPAVANVDMLLIVAAAAEPAPDLELVDKLLLYCSRQGIRPVIVINKCDIGDGSEAEKIKDQYVNAVDDILIVSAASGSGLDKLKKTLSGNTICLAGQSAVGKSSLLNSLLGLDLKTGGLSVKTERGRHTTRHAELLTAPGETFIADTPGFSMLESVPAEPEEIPGMYREFSLYSGSCRFVGCMHISEPDCAVKAAVEAGEINRERYSRYVKIANEAIETRRHKYD